MRRINPALAAGAALLVLGTVLVFRAFDLHSHSASDTLRPFVLTMAPVWAVSIAAVRALLRHHD
jgi:drug/metabolite transporter (DMT)-like permease